MTTLVDYTPRYSWKEIEEAFFAMNLENFGVSTYSGETRESGLKFARIKLMDDMRRRLNQVTDRESQHS